MRRIKLQLGNNFAQPGIKFQRTAPTRNEANYNKLRLKD